MKSFNAALCATCAEQVKAAYLRSANLAACGPPG